MVHLPVGMSFMAPLGAIDEGPASSLADNTTFFKNFEFGVGLRVRRVLAALVFSIGGGGNHGLMRELLKSQGATPGSSIRVFAGLDGAYYFLRSKAWAPWIGARIGYEYLGFLGDTDEWDYSYNYGGVYAALRGGAEWRASSWFGLGPFLELGVGRFARGNVSVTRNDDVTTFDDEEARASRRLDLVGSAAHGYVGGGLRVVFFP